MRRPSTQPDISVFNRKLPLNGRQTTSVERQQLAMRRQSMNQVRKPVSSTRAAGARVLFEACGALQTGP